jgi:hypothetical protein
MRQGWKPTSHNRVRLLVYDSPALKADAKKVLNKKGRGLVTGMPRRGV